MKLTVWKNGRFWHVVPLSMPCALFFSLWRGETFRREFLNIGEIRSLVPSSVGLMALTATATGSTRKQVCRLLGMVHPDIVSKSPNRANIKYIVNIPSTIEEMFAPVIEEIRRCRLYFDKSIIFCCTYDDCSRIYMFIRSRLGSEEVEPISHLI